MDYSFQGFHRDAATFAGQVDAGDLVVVSGNGTVSAAADDGAFVGVCISKRGDSAAIQLYGAVEVSYTGTTAPTVGYQNLLAAGKSSVKVDTDGIQRLVLSVDTTAKKIVFLL